MGHTRGGRRRPQQQQPAPTHDVHVADGIRLQKVMADAGVGSRRECENLIQQGRVEVDGQIVMELGVRVDPTAHVVTVDGLRIMADASKITIAVNKPQKMVATMHDPEGRATVADLVSKRTERLFHVGRLDYESEGLLLLTNDGELANRLSHPRYNVRKTYVVTVKGRVANGVGSQLLRGITLEDGEVALDSYRVIDQTDTETMIEVQLHSGRNRIVRRIFDSLGHPVTRLVRTSIGPIKLGDLKQGRTRVLNRTEVATLMTLVGL